MASTTNVGDRILWTAIICTGIAVYWYVPYYLHHVKDLAAVKSPELKIPEPRLQQDAEASIKLSSLAELARGPNHNLTASAIRLTASRFVKDAKAKKTLLRDLSSKDWHRRDRAINAFRLLLSHPALKEGDTRQHFLNQPTHAAFIAALVNLLPEHEPEIKFQVPASPIRPSHRPAHERSVLDLLLILLEEPRSYGENGFYIFDAQPAINAGIITKWLIKYPFPCIMPETRRYNFRRSDVCRLLEPDVWGSDDPQMSRLVQMLVKLPSGARQLADAGLRTSSLHGRTNIGSREWATRSHPTLDSAHPGSQPRPIWGSDDEATDEEQEEPGQIIEETELLARLQGSQPRRPFARTPGEQSRQRRHRQAVVVAEAGAPLRPENILQRQPTETELTWQQEVQDRQGQLLRTTIRRTISSDDAEVDRTARERLDGLEEERDGFIASHLPDFDAISSESTLHHIPADDTLGQENVPPA
ncbi:hypothetical protein LTR64_004835 [Lithohypha guttulata]|uniref:uncharacterized protein n=1 Tax=Lithohypha guttulata TaxID=1690604 RepID=UPI002DDFA821|nr:hypothetical protein LTR51_005330 [Lithohypha guttulata]